MKTVSLFNGVAVPREAIPSLPLDELRARVVEAPAGGQRVAALFGVPAGEAIELVLVLADDAAGILEAARAEVLGDSFPSMTPDCSQVHLFEREIAEQ